MLANFHDYFVFFDFCQKYCQNEIGDCKQTFTNFSFLTKKTVKLKWVQYFILFLSKKSSNWMGRQKQTFTISFVGFSMGIYISKYSKLKYIFNPLYLMHVDIIL